MAKDFCIAINRFIHTHEHSYKQIESPHLNHNFYVMIETSFSFFQWLQIISGSVISPIKLSYRVSNQPDIEFLKYHRVSANWIKTITNPILKNKANLRSSLKINYSPLKSIFQSVRKSRRINNVHKKKQSQLKNLEHQRRNEIAHYKF